MSCYDCSLKVYGCIPEDPISQIAQPVLIEPAFFSSTGEIDQKYFMVGKYFTSQELIQ